MDNDSKIFVAGHNGLVGSAIVRNLESNGHTNIITRNRRVLDLTDTVAVREFFMEEKPEYVFLAAAKVGGIGGNSDYPADFIYQNLMIQSNVIHSAYIFGTKKLLFLGSSCIYPKFAKIPISSRPSHIHSIFKPNKGAASSTNSRTECCSPVAIT